MTDFMLKFKFFSKSLMLHIISHMKSVIWSKSKWKNQLKYIFLKKLIIN